MHNYILDHSVDVTKTTLEVLPRLPYTTLEVVLSLHDPAKQQLLRTLKSQLDDSDISDAVH